MRTKSTYQTFDDPSSSIGRLEGIQSLSSGPATQKFKALVRERIMARNRILVAALLLILAPVAGTTSLLQAQSGSQADPYLQGRMLMNPSLSPGQDMERNSIRSPGEFSEPGKDAQPQAALPYFQQAVKADPDNAEYQYRLGLASFEAGDYLQAREAFLKAEHLDKGKGCFYLLKCEMRLGHEELAFKYLRLHLGSPYRLREAQLLKDPDVSDMALSGAWRAFWNESEWYSEQDRRYEQALHLYDRGLELEALNLLLQLEKEKFMPGEVRYRQGLIYQTVKNEKAARQALEKALRSDPRHQAARLALAQMQMEDELWEEARNNLNRLIGLDAGFFPAYLLRAEARSKSGETQQALRDLDLVLLYFPENDSLYFLKGRTYMENGKYLDAISQLHRAIRMNQGSALYYYTRGYCYASAGSSTLKQADRDLGMALDLNPSDGRIWHEKGKVALRMGERDSACHCFRKAVQLNYREAWNDLQENCQ